LNLEIIIGAKDFVGHSDKGGTNPVISISTSTVPQQSHSQLQLPSQHHQQQQQQQQRRGSMPCEPTLGIFRGSVNGKRRNNNKKILRRRSSSGAIEILTPIVSESMESTSSNSGGGSATSAWYRFKKDWTLSRRSDSDVLLTKRRGSLPIEVLAIGLGET
jgi:hypothetical protein